MDDNLRRVAKAIQFGVLYGAGPDRIATMIERARTKETRDMKLKKKIKPHGRIRLDSRMVYHFKQDEAKQPCFVCGKDALHTVASPADVGTTGYKYQIYLCTEHFVRMFALPPNRQPKKPKVRQEVKSEKQKALEERMADRLYTLRRFMQSPLTFNGRRVICHTSSSYQTDWYFSLYFNSDEEEYVLSLARIWKKRGKDGMAINLVKDTIKNLALIQGPVLEILTAMDEFLPFVKDSAEHIRVQMAATEFIEQVIAYR